MHAKGAGAHGYFEVTTDIGAQYSQAGFLSEVGKRTPVTARFSTIAGNLGNPDNVRDLRGLAFKYAFTFLFTPWQLTVVPLRFRTEQGILDWVILEFILVSVHASLILFSGCRFS